MINKMNPILAMFVFTIKDVFNVLGAVALIAFFGFAVLAKRSEEKEKEKNRNLPRKEGGAE